MLSEDVKKQFKGKWVYIINMLKHSALQWLNKNIYTTFHMLHWGKKFKRLRISRVIRAEGKGEDSHYCWIYNWNNILWQPLGSAWNFKMHVLFQISISWLGINPTEILIEI